MSDPGDFLELVISAVAASVARIVPYPTIVGVLGIFIACLEEILMRSK